MAHTNLRRLHSGVRRNEASKAEVAAHQRAVGLRRGVVGRTYNLRQLFLTTSGGHRTAPAKRSALFSTLLGKMGEVDVQ